MKITILALLAVSLAGQTRSGIFVHAAAPVGDFTFSVSSSVSITQGATASLTASIVPTGGFTGVVSASVTSGLPSGVTASACSSTLIGSSSCTFTLTASSGATVGTSAVTVTALGGALSHTATSSLTVSASGGATPQLTVVSSVLTSGTTVNLSAASTGWVFYGSVGGNDYTGAAADCTAGLLNNTQTPCNPGAYKLGGSGITPLYVLNTGPGTSNDGRVYFGNGPAPTAITWSWTDSAGPTTSASSSQLFQVVGSNAIQQIALASDPTVKTADIYVYNWNGYANGGGCFSGAGTFGMTFHATDGSVADPNPLSLTSTQGNCSGAKKIHITFATATSSYIIVKLDQASVDLGTSLIAAALN